MRAAVRQRHRGEASGAKASRRVRAPDRRRGSPSLSNERRDAGAPVAGGAVAVVTGASSGIGRELARLLAERRHDLVLTARDERALEELAVELEETYDVRCERIVADLSSAHGVRLLERRLERGDVEVLVNNAGAGWYGPFVAEDPAELAELLQLDVVSVTALCRAALEPMAARRRGAILNVSSIAAFAPGPSCAIYHAAKSYVTSLTEALHEEMKPSGVHVTALCPGPTRTKFHERAGARSAALPRWCWSNPRTVAARALDALARNQAVCTPGPLNRLLVLASRLAPRGTVRRSSAAVVGRLAAWAPGATRRWSDRGVDPQLELAGLEQAVSSSDATTPRPVRRSLRPDRRLAGTMAAEHERAALAHRLQ